MENLNDVVGGFGKIQPDMIAEVMDFVAKMDERYSWSNGRTAFFWSLVGLLNTHIDSPNE